MFGASNPFASRRSTGTLAPVQIFGKTATAISGIAPPNATVTISRDGTGLGSTTADANGAWSYTVTGGVTAGNYVAAAPVSSASFAVVAGVTITGSPGTATPGIAFSFVPTVSGGSGTKSYTLTGSLPPGMSFSSSTGAISGSGTVSGTYSGIAIKVTDASGSATLSGLTIVVNFIASASVRARMAVRQAALPANKWGYYRTRHKTNVAVSNVFLEMWNGYVQNGGVSTYPNTTPETNAGGPVQWRIAILTGVSGTALNQSTATLTRLTWFGMAANPDFVAAGGSVSSDGYTITVPDGWVVRCDGSGVNLSAQQVYMFQIEDYRAAGVRPIGVLGRSDLGDALGQASTQQTYVFSTNFSGGALSSSSLVQPAMVWGTAANGTKVVAAHGDSILSENQDYGDADGVLGYGKRALNAAGYSFFDLSVPGTNIAYIKNYNAMAVRKQWMPRADAFFCNHGNNDIATIGWTGATGYKALIEFDTAFCRANGKPGARVVRCTLNPRTNSTDLWTTLANQTANSNDDKWGIANAARWEWYNYALGTGSYAGQALPSTAADAVYDFYAALGATNGLWPIANPMWTGTLTTLVTANSSTSFTATASTTPPIGSLIAFEPTPASNSNAETPNAIVTAANSNGDGTVTVTLNAAPGKTHMVGAPVASGSSRDGTHPPQTLHVKAANDLAQKLPTLLGFPAIAA